MTKAFPIDLQFWIGAVHILWYPTIGWMGRFANIGENLIYNQLQNLTFDRPSMVWNNPHSNWFFISLDFCHVLGGLVFKKILIGGFWKGKVHVFILNGCKTAKPLILRTPGIEPRPPEDNRFAMWNRWKLPSFVQDATSFLAANFEGW